MQHYEFVLKLCISSRISFSPNKYTYTAHKYWEKVSKTFHDVCMYLRLSGIMNLIFLALSRHNKPYIKVHFFDHLNWQNVLKQIAIFVWYWVTNRKNDWLRKSWPATVLFWTEKIKGSSCLWQEFYEWSRQLQWYSDKWRWW